MNDNPYIENSFPVILGEWKEEGGVLAQYDNEVLNKIMSR